MKKILIFILLAALLLPLVACGGSNETQEPAAGPALPPYLGKWQLNVSQADGTITTHTLTLGENGYITYLVTDTYQQSAVYEEEYSFYDWTEEDYIITCEGAEYVITLLYDEENDTLLDYSNQSYVFKRAK